MRLLASARTLALLSLGAPLATPAYADEAPPAATAPAPADTAPADTAPADTAPADTAPADTAPADTAPVDTAPADTAPADAPPAAAPVVDPAMNLIQLEAATGAITGIGLGALSVSYERLIGDHLSLRVGYGLAGGQRNSFGLGGGDRAWIDAHGPYAMVHVLFGDTHKLELGAGVGIAFYERETTHPDRSVTLSDGTLITPQASIAYRYQPAEGGVFFRIGAMWTLAWGVPFGVGVGYAF